MLGHHNNVTGFVFLRTPSESSFTPFLKVMVCARLDLIYRQGDIAQNVYFVKDGHLRFVLTTGILSVEQ